MTIPVMRPRLPSADALLPYLSRIDASRVYSNFGPLVREFEARLAERLAVPSGCIATAANATLALTAALLAQSPPAGSLCLMPAWTFVASPLAAIRAGLEPYFVDVAADDWLLHADAVEARVARLGRRVGAVMPVAAFGQPIAVDAWDDLQTRMGIAVVIDSAAGFDGLRVGRVPNVVSLHATKAPAAGEGGFVASLDTRLIKRLEQYTAFGFDCDREAHVRGYNAKMSEYHAAVGLAALDGWAETRAMLVTRAEAYRRAFDGANAPRLQPGFGTSWISTTCVIEMVHGLAAMVEERLRAASIETRRWWGQGAHRHAATRAFAQDRLDITDRLGESTFGVPFYVDMPLADVERVATDVLELVGSGSGYDSERAR